jgi:hypothetical protein
MSIDLIASGTASKGWAMSASERASSEEHSGYSVADADSLTRRSSGTLRN